jgi:dTDP-4-dehydro-6-deoxy-alpha-D-gulose 4-ketoreductase
MTMANAQYWCGRTILVTGGRGFIGSHFVEDLAAADARVISLHRDVTPADARTGRVQEISIDLLSTAETKALLRDMPADVDMLVHCAGASGNSEYKASHFGSMLDENIRIASNVLNGARDRGIPMLVMLSSMDVYTGETGGPIREEDDYRAQMRLPDNGYVLSKIFAEILADAYRKQYGMRILVARLTNAYGPGDGARGGSLRVIPAMMQRIATGQPIEIWGDGTQCRSFIYVKDLVRAVLQLAAHGRYDTFNVATGKSVSLLELARLVTNEFGVADRVELKRNKPTGASSRDLNIDRMLEVIDFKPRPIEEGISETVRWYRRTAYLPCAPTLAHTIAGNPMVHPVTAATGP